MTATDSYCRLQPHANDRYGDPCRACGHPTMAHIGVDHCPVCELVALNALQRDQARQDEPAQADPLPEVGGIVHLWRDTADGVGCTSMPVLQHLAAEDDLPAGLLLSRAADPDRWPEDWTQWITRTRDETRTTSGSWHYPCDGDGCLKTEPEPETPEAVEHRQWRREHRASLAAQAAFTDAFHETVRDQRRASLLAMLADAGVEPDAPAPTHICIDLRGASAISDADLNRLASKVGDAITKRIGD